MDLERGTIVIFGCGGHGRSVADVILLRNPSASLLFVDANANENEEIFGFTVTKDFSLDGQPCFFAIGDNAKRRATFERVGGETLISVISLRAHIGRGARIDRGCFVGNFCHVGPGVVVGMNTVLNTGAVIEHEVTIGDHSHIGPGAVILGRCRIGDGVFVGAGAIVRDCVTICSDTIIAAGATVVRDIVERGTYVGTPARRAC